MTDKKQNTNKLPHFLPKTMIFIFRSGWLTPIICCSIRRFWSYGCFFSATCSNKSTGLISACSAVRPHTDETFIFIWPSIMHCCLYIFGSPGVFTGITSSARATCGIRLSFWSRPFFFYPGFHAGIYWRLFRWAASGMGNNLFVLVWLLPWTHPLTGFLTRRFFISELIMNNKFTSNSVNFILPSAGLIFFSVFAFEIFQFPFSVDRLYYISNPATY